MYRFSQGLLWVHSGEFVSRTGDIVELLRSVPGDARYRAPARVASATVGALGLRFLGPWERLQTRAFPRVLSLRIRATVVQKSDAGKVCIPLPLLDISAGGLSAIEKGALRIDDVVQCRLRYRGDQQLEPFARVVREGEFVDDRILQRFVALEFIRMTVEESDTLSTWIQNEQQRGQQNEPERGYRESGGAG